MPFLSAKLILGSTSPGSMVVLCANVVVYIQAKKSVYNRFFMMSDEALGLVYRNSSGIRSLLGIFIFYKGF